jgi:hypothetical protein
MIKWFVTVDNDVKNLINQSNVSIFINNTLLDKRGWKNYIFKKIYVKDGLKLKNKKKDKIFHIKFSSNNTIKNICNLSGLSCADLNKNTIYINVYRWLNGSQKSGLSLINYRKYIIYHEIGHLLGREHSVCPCDGCPRPIMVQATIANDKCIANYYPLDGE